MRMHSVNMLSYSCLSDKHRAPSGPSNGFGHIIPIENKIIQILTNESNQATSHTPNYREENPAWWKFNKMTMNKIL